MTAAALPDRAPGAAGAWRLRLSRRRGVIVAVAVFWAVFGLIAAISAGPLSYFDVQSLAAGGATLAIAAVGQTIVVLSGGFDLSAAAVVSLVNVTLAANMQDAPSSILLWSAVGVGVGMASGAVNGFFIAALRLQPIVVTLSTMFILQGITLLVMDKPGGMIPYGLSGTLAGDAVPGLLPMSVVVVGLVALGWLWLANTRLGQAIYAIGSDAEAAQAAGVRRRRAQFLTYMIAGGCYGLAGVFISAQTGAGDPLVGGPMLLQMFAAIVIGGSVLGGGRGGAIGTIFGAYILTMIANLLLVLNVSAYWSSVVEGAVLLAAVLAGSLGRGSVPAERLRDAAAWVRAWRAGLLPSQRRDADLGPPPRLTAAAAPAPPDAPFLVRHAETLRYAAPAWVCLLLALVATEILVGRAILNPGYYNALIVLTSFLAVLALGQGAVILTGGLDLSVPWTIGLCGILLAGIVQGSDATSLWALPLVLAVGAAIGAANGLGIVLLGVSPIVMTLAMNGILQGAALLYSGGTPAGFSSPTLRWFMTSRAWGVTPVVIFTVLFVAAATLLLTRTPFGRRLYAIGNSPRAAELSGVNVRRTLVGVYALSGFCAALVGALLTGFSGQASLGMGDEYLLPSIAVVVVGGALITGGRGHYLGMLGGALLLTALQTLLLGANLPYAMRAIVFGLVVLGAVIALRDRKA